MLNEDNSLGRTNPLRRIRRFSPRVRCIAYHGRKRTPMAMSTDYGERDLREDVFDERPVRIQSDRDNGNVRHYQPVASQTGTVKRVICDFVSPGATA